MLRLRSRPPRRWSMRSSATPEFHCRPASFAPALPRSQTVTSPLQIYRRSFRIVERHGGHTAPRTSSAPRSISMVGPTAGGWPLHSGPYRLARFRIHIFTMPLRALKRRSIVDLFLRGLLKRTLSLHSRLWFTNRSNCMSNSLGDRRSIVRHTLASARARCLTLVHLILV